MTTTTIFFSWRKEFPIYQRKWHQINHVASPWICWHFSKLRYFACMLLRIGLWMQNFLPNKSFDFNTFPRVDVWNNKNDDFLTSPTSISNPESVVYSAECRGWCDWLWKQRRATEGSNNTRMTVFTTSPPTDRTLSGYFTGMCVMCWQQMLLMNFR